MSFIGAKPTAVPLTGSDITDGIITSAKITDGTIATTDISDGAVTSVKTTGVGGANTPSFFAYISGSAISVGSAYTTVPFNAERFDTASAYNTSTGKFTVPSGQAGTYFFATNLLIGDNVSRFVIRMQKNGSSIMFNDADVTNAPDTNFGSTIISCSVGDEIRVQSYHDKGANTDLAYSSTGEANYFYGFKIII